jgi:glycosyltransferase involved in cell wall biosynthesis
VDSTHLNWERKKLIFEHSRLYIAAPCQWLLDKVKDSILAPAIIEGRVIHNGVDTSLFHPGSQEQSRIDLGLPLHEPILLFVANGIKVNPFKDYATLHAAIKALGSKEGKTLHLIALGEEGVQEQIGSVRIHYIPRTTNMELIAQYYRAADIYLHAAKAETFPNTILEAMACALPVIATNVGGISEQVVEGETGLLMAPQNSHAMLQAIDSLLANPSLRKVMGAAGAQRVRKLFTLEIQVAQYLEWYAQIAKKQAHQS